MIIAIVGVGLIGGSVGLAARRRLGATVRGVDPRAAAALRAGAIDEACDDLETALAGADAAVVAVPVGALPETVARVLAAAPPGCAVTDVGSTKRLAVARAALAAGDRERLAAFQAQAAGEREALLEAGLVGGPVHELRTVVPNRPGVVADIALTLGRAGINISDMALSPSPDHSRGEIALWVAQRDAERAAALVAGLGFPVSA